VSNFPKAIESLVNWGCIDELLKFRSASFEKLEFNVKIKDHDKVPIDANRPLILVISPAKFWSTEPLEELL